MWVVSPSYHVGVAQMPVTTSDPYQMGWVGAGGTDDRAQSHVRPPLVKSVLAVVEPHIAEAGCRKCSTHAENAAMADSKSSMEAA